MCDLSRRKVIEGSRAYGWTGESMNYLKSLKNIFVNTVPAKKITKIVILSYKATVFQEWVIVVYSYSYIHTYV